MRKYIHYSCNLSNYIQCTLYKPRKSFFCYKLCKFNVDVISLHQVKFELQWSVKFMYSKNVRINGNINRKCGVYLLMLIFRIKHKLLFFTNYFPDFMDKFRWILWYPTDKCQSSFKLYLFWLLFRSVVLFSSLIECFF